MKTSKDVREVRETDPDDEPLIGDLRGDVAAHNFWKKGQAVIFDICVTDTDCRSQRHTSPHSCLLSHERRKKRKYVDLCTARKRSFTPLAFSVDGLMGDETIAAMRRLVVHLALKWNLPYSKVVGYTRARLSLALVRASSRCFRAERNPIWRSQDPYWRGGDGLIFGGF